MMEQLFRDFWWLVFPLAWIVGKAVTSFLTYQRQKHALDLIRTYAEKGQEPPNALIDLIQKPIDGDEGLFEASVSGEYASRTPTNYWSLFGLFLVMSVGFAGAGQFTNLDGGSGAFFIVAFTMGAVAVWALVNALMHNRGPR